MSAAPSVPCASVLKPVFAALAYGIAEDWWTIARAAICESDNEATDAIVAHLGGLEGLADALNSLAGRAAYAPGATWGRFLVDAALVAETYAKAIRLDGWASAEAMMRGVREAQRLEIPAGVATKAGWDLRVVDGRACLLTHGVTLSLSAVEARCTAVAVAPEVERQWKRTLAVAGPEAVLPLHRAALNTTHFVHASRCVRPLSRP